MKNKSGTTKNSNNGLKALCIGGTLALGGLAPVFMQAANGTLLLSSQTNDTLSDENEAIIVFTGNNERVAMGLRMFAENPSQAIYVSGYDVEPAWEDLLENAGIDANDPRREQITLDLEALNTMDNGANAAAWIEQNGYRKVTLVTSSFHMRRSYFELSRHLPGGIEIDTRALEENPDLPLSESETLKTACRIYEVTLGIDQSPDQTTSPLCGNLRGLVLGG